MITIFGFLVEKYAYTKNFNLEPLVERFLWSFKEINFIRVLTAKSLKGVTLPPKAFYSQNSYKNGFFIRP